MYEYLQMSGTEVSIPDKLEILMPDWKEYHIVKEKGHTLRISYEQHQDISHVIFSAEWQKLNN